MTKNVYVSVLNEFRSNRLFIYYGFILFRVLLEIVISVIPSLINPIYCPPFYDPFTGVHVYMSKLQLYLYVVLHVYSNRTKTFNKKLSSRFVRMAAEFFSA